MVGSEVMQWFIYKFSVRTTLGLIKPNQWNSRKFLQSTLLGALLSGHISRLLCKGNSSKWSYITQGTIRCQEPKRKRKLVAWLISSFIVSSAWTQAWEFSPCLNNETGTQQQENRVGQNKAKGSEKLRHFHAEKLALLFSRSSKREQKAPCVEKGEAARKKNEWNDLLTGGG